MEVNGYRPLFGYQQYSKYILCSAEERNSYRFGTTRGWINDDRIYIFVYTIPLITPIEQSGNAVTGVYWMTCVVFSSSDHLSLRSDSRAATAAHLQRGHGEGLESCWLSDHSGTATRLQTLHLSVSGTIAFTPCLLVSYRSFIPVKTAPRSQCLLSIRKESSWTVPILPSCTDTEASTFPSHPATGTIQTKHRNIQLITQPTDAILIFDTHL